MNILRFFSFSLFVVFVISCSNEKNEKIILKGHSKSSIFNLNTLLTDEENDVSFPIWFNDSIIKSKRLFKITRKTFLLNGRKENPFKTISGAVPREMREYYFSNQGVIIQLNVHYYYDDREIGSILFSYTGEQDAFGFSQVKRKTIVTKTAKRISETHELFDPEERELDFKMHVKRKGSRKYLAYQDMETGPVCWQQGGMTQPRRQSGAVRARLCGKASAVREDAAGSKGNTAQFPPDGLSTAPAAAARHLRCQNAR